MNRDSNLASSLDWDLIQAILSQPTTSFRESHVQNAVIQELKAANIPFFPDPIGNLIVGVPSKSEYLKALNHKTAEPLRIFIAHTDHPGFHGSEWVGERSLQVSWKGYSPVAHVIGSKVYLANASGYCGEGKIASIEVKQGTRASLKSAVIEVSNPELKKKPASQLFGAFKFQAPLWRDGSLIRAQAADDLIGVCSILTIAREYFSNPPKGPTRFIGLLTRAEEVGLLGTIGHMELGWLKRAKRRLLVVSLETSRQIKPGAEIGLGPVVRQGDRFTTFSAPETFLFGELAEKNLKTRFQKRVMDGGQCEASVAMAYGIPTIAISIPLGNYHNHPFEETDHHHGPSAEFVHTEDFAGMTELCRLALTKGVRWDQPYKQTQANYRQSFLASERLF